MELLLGLLGRQRLRGWVAGHEGVQVEVRPPAFFTQAVARAAANRSRFRVSRPIF